MYAAERRMHSGGRKLHQLMVIADCPLRSLANGGLYVRDVGESGPAAYAFMPDINPHHVTPKASATLSKCLAGVRLAAGLAY